MEMVSLEMAPFDRSHTSSYWRCRNDSIDERTVFSSPCKRGETWLIDHSHHAATMYRPPTTLIAAIHCP